MPKVSSVLLFLTLPTLACGRHGLSGNTGGDAGRGADAAWHPPEAGQPAYRESSERFVQISASNSEACGRRDDGTIRCWGEHGDCRDLDAECSTERGFVAKPSVGSWKFVEVQWNVNICAIDANDAIDCWGYPPARDPRMRLDGTFTVLSNGCAVRAGDGRIQCWGGQLPSPPEGAFVKISGSGYWCGIKLDGTLECWGNQGNAGNTAPPPGTFVDVVAGSGFGCGLRGDGQVICWGPNADVWNSEPALTPQPPGPFVQIAAHAAWICGIRTDGTLACWGELFGYIPPSGRFVQVVVGGTSRDGPDVGSAFFCAMREDGIVVCWGEDNSGESSPP